MLFFLVSLLPNLADGYCPRGCTCDNIQLWVECSNFSLNMVPITLNPHITTFKMQNSNISALNEGFQFYEALNHLDLSLNKINSIADGVFFKQASLRTLNLSQNELRKIGNLSLIGLSSLEELDLADNYLESLEPGFIANCPRLVFLNLYNNNLKLLHRLTFLGGGSLARLDLGRNLLSHVPDLGDSPNLRILSVSTNTIQAFSFCNLRSLLQLDSINLSNTGLTQIVPCHATFRSVRSLDISGNYLTLPLAELLAFPNLKYISAGQRNMTSMSKSSFVGLDNLRRIEITKSPMLTTLETGLFSSLQHLQLLQLHHNPKLEYLPVGLVLAGDTAISLQASDNGIRWIDPGSLPWDRVEHLDLTNNPLHCDCRIAWMISAVTNINHTAVCASPPAFSGIDVTNLNADEFKCVFLDPVQVSVASVCLVVVSLAIGIICFLIYRHRKSTTISDIPSSGYPGYLQHYKGTCKLGWPEKRNLNDGDWDYLEPKCSCREMYETPRTTLTTSAEEKPLYSELMGTFRQTRLSGSKMESSLDITSTFHRSRKQVDGLDWDDRELEVEPNTPDYFLPRAANQPAQTGSEEYFSIMELQTGGAENQISRQNVGKFNFSLVGNMDHGGVLPVYPHQYLTGRRRPLPATTSRFRIGGQRQCHLSQDQLDARPTTSLTLGYMGTMPTFASDPESFVDSPLHPHQNSVHDLSGLADNQSGNSSNLVGSKS